MSVSMLIMQRRAGSVLMKPRGAGAGRVIGQQISGVEALAREFSAARL